MQLPLDNLSRADCHCHTLFSDGSLTPTALLDLARDKNLTGLSITDHDTIGAYESALPYAKELGITLVPGIEISTEIEKHTIHVLGYGFNTQNKIMQDLCLTLQNKRNERNALIVDKLVRHFCMKISVEELNARFPDQPSLGRPHIAMLLFEKGYVKKPQQAFEKYIGDKKRCFVPGIQMEVPEAIDLIHKAGGYAVLAHPHYVKPTRLIDILMSMPFDGIEAYYGNAAPFEAKQWLNWADKKGIFATGGSDFHGAKKGHSSLGSAFTPPEIFELFKKRYQENIN